MDCSFSIRLGVNGVPVSRPVRNGTYISFHDVTVNDTIVLQYDCASSSDVTYTGSNIIILTTFNWIIGHNYYITLDSGLYC